MPSPWLASRSRHEPAISRRRKRSKGGCSGAAGSRRAPRLPGHQRACERGGLLVVLIKESPKPRQRPVPLGEADAVDRQIVHQARVENMLVVAGVPHAGRWLLRHAEEESERVNVLAEHRFVTEVPGDLGETRQELI